MARQVAAAKTKNWATRPAYRRGVRLSVTISPKASKMLNELVATGMYGRNRAMVAQEFIYRGLRELGPDFVRRDR